MPKPILFDPAAVAEARAAHSWYSARSPSSAADFLRELEEATDAIAGAPHRWSPYVESTRRYLLRRFPFFVVYREHDDRIEILAVAHGRRRPGYWKAR